MTTHASRATAGGARDVVRVDEFTDGILDPDRQMLGPVADGGRLVVSTAPGCWGP